MRDFPQDSSVHDVRAAADLGRLISDYLPLRKSGHKLKGLCPFHHEKTPSFTVDPDKGLFYCFGCRTGGDLFDFYMRMEGVAFPDALRDLASRFGVSLRERQGGRRGETGRLVEMHRRAVAFYRASLASDQGGEARRYLQERGLLAETLERLQIGYAPHSWEGLLGHLRAAGFNPEEMIKAGLVARSRKGKGCYDWFRDRILFPIQRVGGGFIGFGGRVLGDSEPKYLNSPESPIFSKGRHLYGLSWAREAIREAECAIIVEGYMDFASLWEAGVRNVVAVLGTGFTPEHAKLLSRFTRSVVINFDSDAAGRQAAGRALTVLLDADFQVRVLELAGAKDPDAFVRAQGAEAYRQVAATAPGSVTYLISRAAVGKDLSLPEDRARAVGALLPSIRQFRNRLLQAAALGQVAHHFDLPEAAVRQEFARLARSAGHEAAPAAGPATARPRIRLAERQLLRRLLDDAASRRDFLGQVKKEDFAGLAAESLLVALLTEYEAGRELSVISLSKVLSSEDRMELMEIAVSDHPEVGEGEWEECWKTLRREKLEKESRRLQHRLQQIVAQPDDSGGIDDLLRKKLDIRRAIDALS